MGWAGLRDIFVARRKEKRRGEHRDIIVADSGVIGGEGRRERAGEQVNRMTHIIYNSHTAVRYTPQHDDKVASHWSVLRLYATIHEWNTESPRHGAETSTAVAAEFHQH